MTELITDEILEAASKALWEADSPAPELGWPHWDVAKERAASELWDLPQMVADARTMARAVVEAAAPLIAAQARLLDAESSTPPHLRAPAGQRVAPARDRGRVEWWWTCDLLHQTFTPWTAAVATQDAAYTALDEHNREHHPHLTEEARRG